MKEIKVADTSGLVTMVDDEDFDKLNLFKWAAHNTGYIWRFFKDSYTFMHHDIIGTPPKGLVVDHIDGNKLNNCRSNLRFVTSSVNNQKRPTWNKFGLRGVSKLRNNGNWQAKIQFKGARIHLGTFKTKYEASLEYDKAALELFGPTAALNNFQLESEVSN